jgi:hypothetical protein
MSDIAWDPEAILALCAAAEDHLLEFFEVCCSRLYYWLNTHALLLSFQAKSKCEREAELVSEVMRLKSQVADLLPYKAKYELGEEKRKKQKTTK